MKRVLYTTILMLLCTLVEAQISTVTSKFSSNLTKNDIPFSGDRKLYAIGLNDKLTDNFIVVSKNKRGAEIDVLFIEKFTRKTTTSFRNTFSVKLTNSVNLGLAFVGNLMLYSDIDKDGNVEAVFVVNEHENGMNTPKEKIWGIVMYDGKPYKMWVSSKDNFEKTSFDDNFKELPNKIHTKVLEFWNSLSKN